MEAMGSLQMDSIFSDEISTGSRKLRFDSDLVTRNANSKSPRTPSTPGLRTSSLTTQSRLTQSTRSATPLAAATLLRQQHQRSMARRSSTTSSPANKQIQDSVLELLSSTIRQLEEIWDNVGCSNDERASQLQQMYSKIRLVCNDTIQEELLVAEQFKKSIHEAREEMQRLCKALSINEYEDVDNEDTCLEEELTSLENRLEQLRTTATNARQELQEIREELIHGHEALNGTSPPPDIWWLDVESDLTDSRQEQFQKELKEMKVLIQSQSLTAVQLLCDCQQLLRELKLLESTDDSSVELGISDFDSKIMTSLVRTSMASSVSSKDPKNFPNAENNNEVPNNKNAANYKIQSIVETETCTGISSVTLERLANRLAELSGEKRRRKQRLGELGSEIAFLWEKLHVSPEEQEGFRQTVQGIGLDTIRKGEKELERLHLLKDGMMGKLILDARTTIRQLWNETSTSPAQQRAFQPFYVDEDQEAFTDDLLLQHEEYIHELESRLEKMLPVLKLISKREEIILERMQYDSFQKDPERLQQRGAALTKQLMMEEKMAKRIKKDLPKLSEILKKKCREWQQEQGEPLLFKGVPYIDTMKRQEVEWRNYKDEEANDKLRRKHDACIAGPENSNSARTGAFSALPTKKKTDVPNRHPSAGRNPSRGRVGPSARPLQSASSKENVIRATADIRNPSQVRVRPTTK